jgi:transcriptional regulator with XRE-family HTH domain
MPAPTHPPDVAQGIKNPLHLRLPQRLKRARKAARIAVSAVATRAALSQETARSIEAGAVPRLDVVERLAAILACSPGWLAYGPQEDPQAAPAGEGDTARHLGAGARLRTAREAAGVTRAELGRAAGTSGTVVLNVEDGRSRKSPSVATVEALADALALSPAWLAFGEGEAAVRPRRDRTP